MQYRLFRGLVAGNRAAIAVKLREPSGVKAAEARIRRGYEIAILGANADVAAAAGAQSAFEERASEGANLFAQLAFDWGARFRFIHVSALHALRKKSGVPKFPDLSATARGRAWITEAAIVQGTPGSISDPMRSRLTPSASTTAPDVSPPATMRRPTPRSLTRPRAIRASARSIKWLLSLAPSFAWSSFTSSGAPVE